MAKSESLRGAVALPSTNGRVAFTDLGVDGVINGRTYRILFTSGTLTTSSMPFIGRSGLPFHAEVITNPPQIVTSARNFSTSPRVLVVDRGGTPVWDAVVVTARIVHDVGRSATLAGALATAVNGVATFEGMNVVCMCDYVCVVCMCVFEGMNVVCMCGMYVWYVCVHLMV